MRLGKIGMGSMFTAALGVAGSFYLQVRAEAEPDNKLLSYADQALDYAWVTLLFPRIVPIPRGLRPIVIGAAIPQGIAFVQEQALKFMVTADELALQNSDQPVQ